MAFISNEPDRSSTLFVLEPDSETPVALVDGTDAVLTSFDWSPDATWIVAVRSRPVDGLHELIRIDRRDGTTTLVATSVTSLRSPRVAPNGGLIAVSRQTGDGSDLLIVEADGGAEHVAVAGSAVTPTPTWGCSNQTNGSVIPVTWLDETRVLSEVTSYCGEGEFTELIGVSVEDGGLDVLATDVDAGSSTRAPGSDSVSYSRASDGTIINVDLKAPEEAQELGQGLAPAVSSSGEIAFIALVPAPDGSSTYELRIASSAREFDSSERVEQLSNVSVPRWSADGARIVASVSTDTSTELWMLDPAAQSVRRVDDGSPGSHVIDYRFEPAQGESSR